MIYHVKKTRVRAVSRLMPVVLLVIMLLPLSNGYGNTNFYGDGSGNVDLIWRKNGPPGGGGEIEIWHMNNTTKLWTDYPNPYFYDLDMRICGTGDFNNDGKSDILWRNYATGENEVWLMDGFVNIGIQSVETITDLEWRIVGTGDFNGDGNVDIVWRKFSNGKVLVWYMDGATRIGSHRLGFELDPNWHIEAVGDFNGDGKPDIVWRSYDTAGEVRIWYVDNETITGVQFVDYVPTLDWKLEGAEDFDNDGNTDLIWRNYNDGKIRIWYMDGAVRTSWIGLPKRTDLYWEIENH